MSLTALRVHNIYKKTALLNFVLRQYNMDVETMITTIRESIPPLNLDSHKGQAGRIGVIGGSVEYTGAPYFAGISAFRAGADLVHIFCTISAASVIKSYSPDIIVHPLLDDDPAKSEEWLNRLHAVVVGPGLGRNNNVLNNVAQIINACRNMLKPLIIDADGTYLITRNLKVIQNYPKPIIITPNRVEFERLYPLIKKENSTNEIDIDFDKLGNNIGILVKGKNDAFYCKNKEYNWVSGLGGSPRRCGGQGDILSGSMSVFLNWMLAKHPDNTNLAMSLASYAASKLVRMSNEKAFEVKGRSMLASDMIDYIHPTFDQLFESKKLNL